LASWLSGRSRTTWPFRQCMIIGAELARNMRKTVENSRNQPFHFVVNLAAPNGQVVFERPLRVE
jgi:hypothetical protein